MRRLQLILQYACLGIIRHSVSGHEYEGEQQKWNRELASSDETDVYTSYSLFRSAEDWEPELVAGKGGSKSRSSSKSSKGGKGSGKGSSKSSSKRSHNKKSRLDSHHRSPTISPPAPFIREDPSREQDSSDYTYPNHDPYTYGAPSTLNVYPTFGEDSTSENNIMPPQSSPVTLSPSDISNPIKYLVDLEEFSLTYSFDRSDRDPDDLEISAALSITNTYLTGFFKQRIDVVEKVDTSLGAVELVENQPFKLSLVTTAVISESEVEPTAEELDLLRELSFSEDNMLIYIGLLQLLPPENIFSTTVDVSSSPYGDGEADSNPSEKPPSNEEEKSSVAIVASVGAGTFLALLVGLKIYRRTDGNQEQVKLLDNNNAGLLTVADETYMGNSTMYSMSEQRSRGMDDNQSEWGISTQAQMEDVCSVTEPVLAFQVETPESQKGNLDYHPSDPLAPPIDTSPPGEYSAPSNSLGSDSEDEDVPLRVVDLIKKFSPLR